MTETSEISPMSAARHYAAGAEFWEQRAKALQHRLDQAGAAMQQAQTLIAHGSPEELSEAKAALLTAESST